MPSVDCDNKDCILFDDRRGCDADRLVIERGVCMGSIGYGRNVSENDLVEKLDVEIAELRGLVRDMWRFTGTACKKYPRLFDPAAQGGQMVHLNMLDSFEQRMRELGIEVEE